jgi:hypothetical protein
VKALLIVALIGIGSTAHAGIPLLNATCGAGVEVHADQGGPVYINGKQAALKRVSEHYYEAKGANVTISLAINPDGTPNVSATWRGGKNGICSLTDDNARPKESGCPADVSQADRYRYPGCR